MDARSRRSSLDMLIPYQDLSSEIDNNLYPQLEAKFIDSSRPGSEKKSGLTLSIPNTQVSMHVPLNVYLHAYKCIPGYLVYVRAFVYVIRNYIYILEYTYLCTCIHTDMFVYLCIQVPLKIMSGGRKSLTGLSVKQRRKSSHLSTKTTLKGSKMEIGKNSGDIGMIQLK